jgi:electron transport complex protein RnfG
MIKHKITVAGLLLAMFAVFGTGLVAFTHLMTKDQIAENERQALLKSLSAMVPAESIDNDIINDKITVMEPEMLGGEETTVYRGRKGGAEVAAVFTTIAPGGYSGNIKLLVAVKADGSLAGVRVVVHKETPGLGDKIEIEKDDWILSFNGKSLSDPTPDQWGVKRDGGVFDQFTGATITPRAIVKAVKNTLLYFKSNREAIFAKSEAIATPEDQAETKGD